MTARERDGSGCTLVVFGVGSDLMRRKLLPALLQIGADGALPDRFAVVGVDKADLDDGALRDRLDDTLEEIDGERAAAWSSLRPRVRYVPGRFEERTAYERLEETLREVEGKHGATGRLFYLACPPRFFGEVARQLGDAGLAREENGAWRRLVIEKPFGRDLDSARDLNRQLRQDFSESQLYRIDHFLGKETVQNILAFRFANGVFEPVWNRRYVDSVEITVAETLGVEGRGAYYDAAGHLRDMVPNHLFQILTLIAMEPPAHLGADAIRDEKGKVLRSIPPWSPEEAARAAVRGQYGPGHLEEVGRVPGYADEESVDADSTTETFVALRLEIESWRWAGVPFYLRTGKRLARRRSEVVVKFRCPPLQLFRDTPVDCLESNHLAIRIQPDEGISLGFQAKRPGPEMTLGPVDMGFDYASHFEKPLQAAYATLLLDAMEGDPTLFQRADNVEAGWKVVQPLLEAWASSSTSLEEYAAGSEGPEAARALLDRDGRSWHPLL